VELCVATKALDAVQATAIVSALQEAGVQAQLRGSAADDPDVPGPDTIDVLVNERDLPAALDVLARAEVSDLDGEAEDA
jgi:hypothetical protein